MYSDSVDRGYRSYKAGNTSPRINNGNNPFDISEFNEVRPTYVGPPVEDIAKAREYLTKTSKENRISQTMLDKAFSTSINNMQGDDTGVALIQEHKRAFEDVISTVSNESNMAYAGPAIQNSVSRFAKDYRIVGRQGIVDKHNATMDAIKSNKNLDVDAKEAWLNTLNNNLDKYATRDDEKGIYDYNSPLVPFEAVDVNAELLKGISLRYNMPELNTGANHVKFLDANGRLSSTYDPNGQFVIVDSKNTIVKTIKKGDLEQAMRSIITNNRSLRGYLLQSGVLDSYFKDESGEIDPIDALSSVLGNPSALNNAISSAVNDLAEAYASYGTASKHDIKALRLNTGTSSSDTTHQQSGVSVGFGATNSYTANPSREAVHKTIGDASNSINSSLDGTNGEGETVTVNGVERKLTDAMANSVREGRWTDFMQLATNNADLDPSSATELISQYENNITSAALADTKYKNAYNKALYPVEGEHTVGSSKYPLIASLREIENATAILRNEENESPNAITAASSTIANNEIYSKLVKLRELGFDYENYDGETVEDKVKALLDDVDSKANMAMMSDPYSNLPNTNNIDTNLLLAHNTLHDGLFNNFANTLDNEHSQLNKDIDAILETPVKSTDFVMKVGVLGGNSVNAKQDLANLHAVFENPSLLVNLIGDKDVYTTDGAHYGASWFADAKSIKVDDNAIGYTAKSSDNDNGVSWVVPMAVTQNDGTVHNLTAIIPMDADNSGVEQEYFTRYIKNNPMFEASKIVTEMEQNNVVGDINNPFYADFVVHRDYNTSKLTYKDSNGTSYSKPRFVEALADAVIERKVSKILLDNDGTLTSKFYNNISKTLTTINNGGDNKEALDDLYESIYGTKYDGTDPTSVNRGNALASAINLLLNNGQ